MEEIKFRQSLVDLINNYFNAGGLTDELKDAFMLFCEAYKHGSEDEVEIYAQTVAGLLNGELEELEDTIKEMWSEYNKGKDPKDIPTRLDIEFRMARYSKANGFEIGLFTGEANFFDTVGEVEIYAEEHLGDITTIPFDQGFEEEETKVFVNLGDVDVFCYAEDSDFDEDGEFINDEIDWEDDLDD